jgi:starch-binding outer membrane protein, SusD/RagB family
MVQQKNTNMFNYKIVTFLIAVSLMISCKKGWIEEKSNKSLDVPTSVKDFQALLDNSPVMNDQHPSWGETSSDNYYLTNSMWQAWGADPKNVYIWNKDIYSDASSDNNWNNPYRQVFYSNVVLDDIDKVASEEIGSQAWNNVKGSAYYFRADGFFNVAQLYAKPYSLTFPEELGIPLRLKADPNEISVRAGLQKTYEQILSDLHAATGYLPVIPQYKHRPSKPAAYAMLSRVYLVMQDYSHSLLYADSCLKLYDSLLDYNTLNATASYPIPGLNKEVLFQTSLGNDLFSGKVIVDSNLYKSYNVNDLRQKMFYKTNTNGGMLFVGTYTGGTASAQNFFGGLATDEVYLTRAECLARAGNITAAMNDLNALMVKRFVTGTFVPFTAANTSEALNLILQERRKETPFRGLRWLDLRRLNSEGANIVLTRKLNNETYTLQPNSSRYVLPIPPDIIRLTGVPQNER